MTRLDQIKERLGKATEGEWHSIEPPDTRVCDKDGYMVCSTADFSGGKHISDWKYNQDFIANSKPDIQFLLSEVARKDEALKSIEEWDEHPCEWPLIDKVNYYRRKATAALKESNEAK